MMQVNIGHVIVRYGSVALLSVLLAVGVISGSIVIHFLRTKIKKSKTVQYIEGVLSADMVSLFVLCVGAAVTLGAGTWVLGDNGCILMSILIRTASSAGIMSRLMLAVHRFRLLLKRQDGASGRTRPVGICLSWIISVILGSLVEVMNAGNRKSFLCECASGWLQTIFDVVTQLLPTAITILFLAATYVCQKIHWRPGAQHVNPVTNNTSSPSATRQIGNDESAGLTKTGLKAAGKLTIAIGPISCLLLISTMFKIVSQNTAYTSVGWSAASLILAVVCYAGQPIAYACSFKSFYHRLRNLKNVQTIPEHVFEIVQNTSGSFATDSNTDLPLFLQRKKTSQFSRHESASTGSKISANQIDITTFDTVANTVQHAVEIHHKISSDYSIQSTVSIFSTQSAGNLFTPTASGIANLERRRSLMVSSSSTPIESLTTSYGERWSTATAPNWKRPYPLMNKWVCTSSSSSCSDSSSGGTRSKPSLNMRYSGNNKIVKLNFSSPPLQIKM